MNAKNSFSFFPTDEESSDLEEDNFPSQKVENLKNKNFYFIVDSLHKFTQEKAATAQNFAAIIKRTPFQSESTKDIKRVRKKSSNIEPIISEISTSSSLKKSEAISNVIIPKKRVSFSGYQSMPKSRSKGILKLEMSRYSSEEEEGRKRAGSVDILKYKKAQFESEDAEYLAELEAQWEIGNFPYFTKREYSPVKFSKKKYSISYIHPANKQENQKSRFSRSKRNSNVKRPINYQF